MRGTRCRQMGYSFHLAARVLLYASSHRQGSTYYGLCYTSRRELAGTRNSSMGPPWRIDVTIHRTMSEHSCHGATSRSPHNQLVHNSALASRKQEKPKPNKDQLKSFYFKCTKSFDIISRLANGKVTWSRTIQGFVLFARGLVASSSYRGVYLWIISNVI